LTQTGSASIKVRHSGVSRGLVLVTLTRRVFPPMRVVASPVSRLRCRGENTDAECTLDVNVDIYPLKAKDKVAFALSYTLAEDGKPDDGTFEQARPRASVAQACVHAGVLKPLSSPAAVVAVGTKKVAARQVRIRHVWYVTHWFSDDQARPRHLC